jgi:hypothetical protein
MDGIKTESTIFGFYRRSLVAVMIVPSVYIMRLLINIPFLNRLKILGITKTLVLPCLQVD